MRDIRCILGFHKFEFEKADERFMPNMKILTGSCTRKDCIESEHWFLNYKEKRIFGGYGDNIIGFPMDEKYLPSVANRDIKEDEKK